MNLSPPPVLYFDPWPTAWAFVRQTLVETQTIYHSYIKIARNVNRCSVIRFFTQLRKELPWHCTRLTIWYALSRKSFFLIKWRIVWTVIVSTSLEIAIHWLVSLWPFPVLTLWTRSSTVFTCSGWKLRMMFQTNESHGHTSCTIDDFNVLFCH